MYPGTAVRRLVRRALLGPIGHVPTFPFPIETLSCTKTLGRGRPDLGINVHRSEGVVEIRVAARGALASKHFVPRQIV